MSNALQKGKVRLVMNHAYFAMTALKMEYVEDESVGTMSIGTEKIRYAKAFVESIRTDELEAVLAHEVLHYLLLHHIRGIGKDHDDWNKACDYVVNAILRKYGFKLPLGHLYDPKFENMDADQVYNIIHRPDNKQQQPQNGQSKDNSLPQNWGKMDMPEPGANIKEAEIAAKEAAQAAMEAAQGKGKLAGKGLSEALIEALKDVIEPKQNWRELLLKFIAEIAKNDYDWSMPSGRYLPSGIYLPRLHSIEVGKVVFAIDTSSSVDKELLKTFVAEIKEASEMFAFPVTVLHCDTIIRKVEEMDYDTEIIPVGRGATNFYPVFDYVNDEMPDTKAVVYFTDGYCDDKLQEPDYEVLWVIYGNPRFKAQFGEVVHFDVI